MKIHFSVVGAVLALAGMFATAASAGTVAPHEVDGVVNDSLGRPLSGASVHLKGADGHGVAETNSDSQGHFHFNNIASGTYSVMADLPSFQTGIGIVTVSDQAGGEATVTLTSSQALNIQIKARKLDIARNSISVETGSSIYRIQHKDIADLPLGESTSFNQVILQAPGVVQDSFGQVHVRGDHADLQYRINDIILPESISGFGQTLDTRFMENLNLLTGALPAQYGYRTAGVVDIHTKSGAFANGGEIGVTGGSNDTREIHGDVSGNKGNFNYYMTGSLLKNDLGIENPTGSTKAIHDDSTQGKGFGYFSYLLNESSRLSLILGSSDGHFQIPNVQDQPTQFNFNGYLAAPSTTTYPSTNLNENQHELTNYAILALQGTAGENVDYQVAAFSRYTKVEFDPDQTGDLLYNGVASQVLRTGLANGLQADGSYKLNANHTLRSGLYFSAENLKNNNDVLTFPGDSSGNQTSDIPISFSDNGSKTAYLYSLYLQDEWKATDKLTVNYGARADRVDAYVTGSQLSPRLGAVYQATAATTLHAGYARYFTPPPTELITNETIADFQNTTDPPLNNQNDQVKPERDNYYDLGISHAFDPHFTMGLDGYYKDAKNLIDEGQFGPALIFTPFNYAQGKVYGAELTANYHKDNLSAYLNIARSTARGKDIVSSQYQIDPGDLAYIANNWIYLDHDQTLTASAGASYLWYGTTYSADALYGSGLRKDSDVPNGGELPGYTQINLAAAHTFDITQLGKIEGRLSVINAFDKKYEIRDGTGVGVGAPQFGPRRAIYATVNKYF
jgi:outer membrane receptor protein involved in Fe transport